MKLAAKPSVGLAADPMPPGPGFVEAVERHPFLKDLEPEFVEALHDCAMETNFQSGELIFRQGDPANRFYLIQQGKVALESSASGRDDILITEIGGGEVLGWSWLFEPYQWHFTARAVEPTTAIFFYGTLLRQRCESEPSLGYELMRRMAAVVIERLQSTRRLLLAAQT